MLEHRRIEARDRSEIEALLVAAGVFQPHEIAVAMELVDIALNNPVQTDYHPWVLIEDKTIVAYACFGRNPMTRSTYDLYWIATGAEHFRRGYGRTLFGIAEEKIRALGGKLLMVETSSQERYRGSNAFYARMGCELVARVADFYDEGDDQLLYCKRLR